MTSSALLTILSRTSWSADSRIAAREFVRWIDGLPATGRHFALDTSTLAETTDDGDGTLVRFRQPSPTM
jgi:hypothetical protein